MSIIRDIYGIGDTYLRLRKVNLPNVFIAGAELEIEGVRDWSKAWCADNGVNIENDGSLRNGGKEFLLPPSKLKQLSTLFEEFHGRLEIRGEAFSARTSTHVHVNCLYCTEEQVRDLLYLYAIFEPLAFAYVGEDRRENIHCMPLWSTNMPNHYALATRFIHQKWHKYTALNLLPLNELGTVEFRHLYGTKDVNVFTTWLEFLETLWTEAQSWGGFRKEHLLDLTKLRRVQEKLLTLAYFACAKERPIYKLEDNLLDIQLTFL